MLLSFFFSWMHQALSALSDTDMQTTDCTTPGKMLWSLGAALKRLFRVCLLSTLGVWRKICLNTFRGGRQLWEGYCLDVHLADEIGCVWHVVRFLYGMPFGKTEEETQKTVLPCSVILFLSFR